MTRTNRLLAMLMICAVAPPAFAQWLAFPTPGIPRTAEGKPNLSAPAPLTHDGDPDLSGLWTLGSGRGDLFSSEKAQPWAQALLRQREENFFKDSPNYLCLPIGPAAYAAGGMKRIVQTPAVIVILNEDLSYRQIFMDGRALETDPNPTWMGYSVGRWEGETLVVESAGFNDKTWLTGRGLAHTEALRMTERFRRSDFGHLAVDVTFSDPTAFTAPLHHAASFTLAADTSLLEAVCETPHGQQHWVGKVSDSAKTAVKLAPQVLAQYVGVYKGLWFTTPRTVRVTLDDGALFARINETQSLVPLIPQSDTLFVGGGLGYLFVRNPDGNATAVIEQHISGSYTYPRQAER